MQAKKYYRLQGETEDGEDGLYHYEVKDGIIVRQICIVNGIIYWADEDDEANDKYGFTDQPEIDESELAELPEYMKLESISLAEFEELWAKGKSECQ